MITLEQESQQRKKSPIDLDKLADQYKTENGLFIFPSPSLELIERNIFYLMKNSIKKKFNQQYNMRPDYLSFDEYGTVILAPLLMYVNGVFSVEDFNLSEVIIPQFSYILKMVDDPFPDKKSSDLEEINW